jgi:hypothetical protein
MPENPDSSPPDELAEPLTMDEVEERVAAALKVNPAGILGRLRLGPKPNAEGPKKS